jgi:hypothetical protein
LLTISENKALPEVAESFLDPIVYAELKQEEASMLPSPTAEKTSNRRKSRIIEPEEEMARQKRISRRSMQITSEESEKAAFFSKMLDETETTKGASNGGLASEFSDYFGFLGFGGSENKNEEKPLPPVKDGFSLPEKGAADHGWTKELNMVEDGMLDLYILQTKEVFFHN